MFASRYKKIGAKIVFYRKLRSMTQEKLAEEVGITPQYLSRIENGGYTKSVSLSTLMMIAGALDVTMSQLMEGVEDTSL
ncbi:helix-turn-helix domain-containing protein [Phascolarctobacterium succinatutens]|jgi:transcriptional regulator with XRE-family HTH domain|uniref:helix-turn-helix domain-containing protein n=1 Tax=Phascolarctobacterium succinatutens TaxID=626940 RepID=UPI0023F8FD99|nr:helix-turn-helix transcriptional regulator [Phascolarctobacterium succinatutens]